MRARRARVALILWIGIAQPALSESLAGRVVGITDGDTFELLVERAVHKIRIAEIDAPERGQPFAAAAKRALSDLIFDRNVVVDVTGTSHGRLVGEVWLGDRCVGCALVSGGHAWAAIGYVRHESLVQLEREARRARRGLWSAPKSQRVEPWREREQRRDGEHASPRPAVSDPPDPERFVCGKKGTCKEMASCAEARFNLQRCDLRRIDGDGDGVPCEDLCR